VVGRNGMVRGTVSVAFEDFLGNPLEEDFLVLSFVIFLPKLRFKLFDVRHPNALKTLLSIFNHLGYHADYRVLNSADHGVPQVRKRLFFIATRRDWRDRPIVWPEPQFAPVLNKGISTL
jgi:site-specific DNA-cytosine methylase